MSNEIPSVTEVIAERIQSGSKPWDRNDPWKIGYIAEGGSMRGVISGGAAVYLQSINAFHAFDAAYSVSAGSCTTFYTASRQTPEGTSIYYQDINNSHFINPKRILQRKPPVDISFLTHQVMMERKILDWQKVKDCTIPLHTFATDALTGEAIDLYPFTDRENVHDAMLYSCLMPVLAGLPKRAHGTFLTDGMVATGGIPLEQAMEDDCTHILITLTKPNNSNRKQYSKFDLLIYLLLSMNGFTTLAKCYLKAHERYTQTLKRIYQNDNNLPRIQAVSTGIAEISLIERRSGVLRDGAIAGFEAARRSFHGYNLPQNPDIYVI